MRTSTLLFAGLMAVSASSVAAQNAAPPQTARVAGMVEKSDGKTVTVKTDQGSVNFNIVADTAIMVREPAKLSDIGPNTFLGTTAVEKNGKMEATEIHIFPESMRGAGEGHRPMQAPMTTMTNGSVTTMTNGSVASIANGGTMKVAYAGGEKEVTVPAGVEITIIKPLTAAALTPGTKLTATVRQNADGSASGTIVTIVK